MTDEDKLAEQGGGNTAEGNPKIIQVSEEGLLVVTEA